MESDWRRLALVMLAVLVASAARARAVRDLPRDYDELDYIPAGFEYARRMEAGRRHEIPGVKRNAEHPALVKLLHRVVLRAARAPEPDGSELGVGKPIPEAARPAFLWTRALSAVAGVAQVLLVALVSGVGDLWLALDAYADAFTPSSTPGKPPRRRDRPTRTYRVPWADLLKKVFAVDVLACPCAGRLQLIAFIAEATVARRILDHLGLDSRGPPVAHAQAPPDAFDPVPSYDGTDPVFPD